MQLIEAQLDPAEVRISVVDDNKFDLKTLATVLKNAGFNVVCESTSAEQLETQILEENSLAQKCDLFLLDFNLPGKNGIELCRHLKSHPVYRNSPVILITGEATVLELQRAYNEGVVDFIRKPFNRIELLARVTLAAKNWKMQLELTRMAHYDSLTGLINRDLLLDRLDNAIRSAHRNDKKVALLFIDLDNFKPLNDSLGHKLGDIALQKTATRLEDSVRDSDTVARFGGDEFIIMLPNVEDNSAIERILHGIETRFSEEMLLYSNEGGSITWKLGASIGVAMFPDDAGNSSELIKLADMAMYNKKTLRKRTSSAG